MEYLALIFGLTLLLKGGDLLMKSAVALSINLKISKFIIGMTVVSFATSAPELIVSIQAAVSGFPDLAFGNVIGSNIANLAFVLAIIIIISPIEVNNNFIKKDWPMMMISTFLFYLFIYFDKNLSRVEGVIMVLILLGFLIYLIKFSKNKTTDEFIEKKLSKYNIFIYLLMGGFSLWLGSEVLVKGAVELATQLGVSERVISITVISIGTSIPELSASIVAIINKEKAISLGNIIGSNIFNILAVMGITAIITPIEPVDLSLLSRDFLWMIFISFIILPMVFFPTGKILGRVNGVILFVLYLCFILPLII
jgi:cation:H+ antiporter